MTEAGVEDARWKVVAELEAPAWIPATPLALFSEEADPGLLLEPVWSVEGVDDSLISP
jgi:hypothetical protein